MSGDEVGLDDRIELPGTFLTRLGATAVVLTYRRPRLASEVVRGLLKDEGVPAASILLVVNGEGGLDDPALEASIRVLRLDENLGPAGGFARAFQFVHETTDVSWIYACEDDAGLFGLPSARLASLIERVEAFEQDVPGNPVGLIGTSGWNVDRRTGRTSRHHVQVRGVPFEEVDFSGWGGAMLLSRRVVEAGIVPDESFFWGAEEVDFCLRVQRAGFRVLVETSVVDRPRSTLVEDRPTRRERPERVDEPWCSYYMARNGFLLRRRFGDVRWTLWHLRKSARRFQLAPSTRHRVAIVRGLVDGFLGRSGRHPSYVREVGEW